MKNKKNIERKTKGGFKMNKNGVPLNNNGQKVLTFNGKSKTRK